MDDTDFTVKAATLLAQCSPGQRTMLSKLIENFGKSDEPKPVGAADAALGGRSVDKMFPHLKRLSGSVADAEAVERRYPKAGRPNSGF